MRLEREGLMQNPYKAYQKNQVEKPGPVAQKEKIKKRTGTRRKPIRKAKEKHSLSVPWIMASLAGLSLSFYIFAYTDQFIDLVSRIDIGMTWAGAAEEEKNSPETTEMQEKAAALPVGKVSNLKSDSENLTMKNASVFDALEEELQRQKVEIEQQLKEMQEIRRNISSKLDKKEVADQESINKLVGVYANMKPQNAAIILSQIDDDLAVKVLGKMKKQNAAAILNFVQPQKAQMLSEKFTGLKK